MRLKWFGLFGILLAFMLVAGPLVGSAMAAGDHEDPHAGHDMSTMNHSDQTSEHDMHDMEGMSQDGSASEHEGTAGGDQGSSHSSHDLGAKDGHDSTSGGHGGESQDPNTPPNWPVIYGFGAFNLLVLIAAALLKNKGVNGVN